MLRCSWGWSWSWIRAFNHPNVARQRYIFLLRIDSGEWWWLELQQKAFSLALNPLLAKQTTISHVTWRRSAGGILKPQASATRTGVRNKTLVCQWWWPLTGQSRPWRTWVPLPVGVCAPLELRICGEAAKIGPFLGTLSLPPSELSLPHVSSRWRGG